MILLRAFATALLVSTVTAGSGRAQTDFYNLDKNRPLRVEDAHATKRWAFELQAAPLALSWDRDGGVRYRPAMELKHGVLPGVELSAGWTPEIRRSGAITRTAAGELEASALANLWVEGSVLPAAALRVTLHTPLEGEHPSSVEVKGIVTRTVAGPVRAHLNGAVVLGEDRSERGWGGLALDWVLPFQHLLLMAEGWVADLSEAGRAVHSTVGLRFQVGPTLVLDAGAGRSWRGEASGDWELVLGLTREFGVRSLMPGGVR